MKDIEKRLGYTFFKSYMDMMVDLNMHNRGKVITAMNEFFFDDKSPNKEFFDDDNSIQRVLLRAVWNGILPNLTASRNRSNKGKAGAPVGNKNACKSEKQSKNNQSPSENKDKKIIENSMIVENNTNNISSYPLYAPVKAMWVSRKDNEVGLEEARWLQDEITRFRNTSGDIFDEKEFLNFLTYWSTPLDTGDYANHCRYIEMRENSHSFNVTVRLKTWKEKIKRKED